ncbi:helix-turn-helix transcriptional regulator [Pseudooctadecabacter sp.]|uniref:helix-turn-helix transcriptional regulator n=1 Tax=Pseudooctadecabacter sp. TaxID=1966338 RepID=UPI0025CF8DFD|nr:helix-turn-helix transcriptional regulator [Pseudooctadecabacter sp.]
MSTFEQTSQRAGHLIRLVFVLTRALSGRGDLRAALAELALLCAASDVRFLRIDHRVSVIRVIAALDDMTGEVEDNDARTVSHGKKGQLAQVATPQAPRWGMILDEGYAHTDVVMLTCPECEWLEPLAQELPVIWGSRIKGVIASMVSEEDKSDAILGPRNPFNLTQTERKVCHLLTDGLSAKDVAQRLEVSMPTVRTHLRNIYAKTGLDGMVAVVHRLHSDGI